MNGKGIHFETAKGQRIRARQASDGAILFLGFLALAYLGELWYNLTEEELFGDG